MKGQPDETAAPPRRAGHPLIGLVVEGFEIQSFIGSGAMGDVYRGIHTVIGKPVAIKVLKPELAQDEDMVQRLIREARAVNAIKHPGIVDIFNCGTLAKTNQPYIVMELLEGESLEAFLERAAPVPFKTLYTILEQLLQALAAAHDVGVIHRDLKPGNVFLERHAERWQATKLLDFGLARQALQAQGSVDPTRPGILMGTPAFMAPEQVLGTKVGPQTDLYALGGIAYQMATGHLPHEAENSIEILSLKLRADPPPPSQWNSQVPEALDRWIMQLLIRDPDRRPRSANEAREQLVLIRDARKPSAVEPAENDAAIEPKTILFDQEPSAQLPADDPEQSIHKSGGTRLFWGNASTGNPPAIKEEFIPEPFEAEPTSVPVLLVITLAASFLAISAGLWWLFNS